MSIHMLKCMLNDMGEQVHTGRMLVAEAITGHQPLIWGKVTSGEKLCLPSKESQNWCS